MSEMVKIVFGTIMTGLVGWIVYLLKRYMEKKELLYQKSIVNLMRLENETEDEKVSIKYGDEVIHNLHAVDITVYNLRKQRIQFEDFDQYIERPFTVFVEGEGKILGARVIETKPENLIPIDWRKGMLELNGNSVGIKPIPIGKKQRLKIRLLIGNLQETDRVKVNIHGNFETKENWMYRWIFPILVLSAGLFFIIYCFTIFVMDHLPKWFFFFHYFLTAIAFGLAIHSIARLKDMGFIKELRKASKLNNRNYQGK